VVVAAPTNAVVVDPFDRPLRDERIAGERPAAFVVVVAPGAGGDDCLAGEAQAAVMRATPRHPASRRSDMAGRVPSGFGAAQPP